MVLAALNPHPDLTEPVIRGLGVIYLVLTLMNVGWGFRSYRKDGHVRMLDQDVPIAAFWFMFSGLLLMVSLAHLVGGSQPDDFSLRLPGWFKTGVNGLADPISFFTLSMLLFVLLITFRKWLVKPTVGWVMLNASLLFLAVSMTDWDFRQIVGKPDNVPIVAMLFIVGYFTWLYFARAVENDRRQLEGRPLLEQENNGKVLVWPDLVYSELICMIAVTAFLIVWGIYLQAPLEEPASAVKTPNPSKAPWYFLGLQEMLVYYDPWLAGVVFPSVIVGGLMALPYIDFNKLGNGYYSFVERRFAVTTFLLGFLPLWIGMIVLGTFLRGPNWNFFGIYEYWDAHKLEALNNVNLSEHFWLYWTGSSLPQHWFWRELPGIIVVIAYLTVLPPIMAATCFRKYYVRMGFLRFMVFSNLVLLMAALPIKMLLRWSPLNLKYIVAIPELFFNI